tara:strand:+ start:550 stop:855 length:306 start_codon:yes stop_codon:yes gene_type:complete
MKIAKRFRRVLKEATFEIPKAKRRKLLEAIRLARLAADDLGVRRRRFLRKLRQGDETCKAAFESAAKNAGFDSEAFRELLEILIEYLPQIIEIIMMFMAFA